MNKHFYKYHDLEKQLLQVVKDDSRDFCLIYAPWTWMEDYYKIKGIDYTIMDYFCVLSLNFTSLLIFMLNDINIQTLAYFLQSYIIKQSQTSWTRKLGSFVKENNQEVSSEKEKCFAMVLCRSLQAVPIISKTWCYYNHLHHTMAQEIFEHTFLINVSLIKRNWLPTNYTM